jgi:hypothetical protein
MVPQSWEIWSWRWRKVLRVRTRVDLQRIANCLDPAVVHQGVAPHLRCDNRDQVLDNVRGTLAGGTFGIDRLEMIDAAGRVIVGLAGPRFRDVEWTPLQGQVFIVFTVSHGLIVRMDDFVTRGEAMTKAEVESVDWA